MCRWIMGAQQFQANVATPEGKMRNKIAQSCIQAINHLARTMKSVVYAADCVSGHQGTGMASPSFHNLPSTITTTTNTTTTSTISNSSKNASCATSSSSSSQQHHHKHSNHHHHHHHHRQQDYLYPRDQHQAHQPHTINPTAAGGGHQYTLPTSKQHHQHQHSHQQQQCCGTPSPAMPPACLTQYYPARIPLPDGEERPHGGALGRHTKEKVSELKRPYIKPPANKTLYDVQLCKARLPPSGDLNQLPLQLPTAAQYCSSHLQASPTPPPPLSPTQPTLSRPHKHQSREKDGGRGGVAPLSPQPSRKPKNLIANYMATFSSPKNRKESNLRKSSQQNSGYSNSSSSSCSSNSSSSSSNANSCCNSTNYKILFGMSGGRDRVRGSSATSGVPSGIPSDRDHLQGYSSLSSSLPSPELPAIEASLRDSFTASVLTEAPTDGLSSSIPCSAGPSSVSEITLLPCHPSSMNTCSHSSCIISQQKSAIQYQQQHYQQPQYLQPQYQHHDHRPHSPQPPLGAATDTSPPPHYHKLSYHHHQQHNPLTSSISSSPPASPSCPSPPPSTSPEQYEEFSDLPPRGDVPPPLDGSSQFLLGPASRDGRSCSSRPSSLTSDEFLLQSQQPPSYREVLEHPDRFRELPPSYSASSSSTNTRNSISLTSVPCDNDSIEAGSCNSPVGGCATSRDKTTSRSRGGAELGGDQGRHRCCDLSRTRGTDSESSSEGDDDPTQRGAPHPVSQRQLSLSSSREAVYGSCYEKEVI